MYKCVTLCVKIGFSFHWKVNCNDAMNIALQSHPSKETLISSLVHHHHHHNHRHHHNHHHHQQPNQHDHHENDQICNQLSRSCPRLDYSQSHQQSTFLHLFAQSSESFPALQCVTKKWSWPIDTLDMKGPQSIFCPWSWPSSTMNIPIFCDNSQ